MMVAKMCSYFSRMVLILVKEKEKIIGAVTGIPLDETDPMFLSSFIKHQVPIHSVFYLGEILLLKEYRGKGLGYKAYTLFENLVRQKATYTKIALAEILRDPNDPRKPKNYIPAHALWERLGYIEDPAMTLQAPYKEVGSTEKLPHTLVFSFKDLK